MAYARLPIRTHEHELDSVPPAALFVISTHPFRPINSKNDMDCKNVISQNSEMPFPLISKGPIKMNMDMM